MAFTVPDFNLDVNIWHLPNAPFAAPDLSLKCNLAYARRVHNEVGGVAHALMQLLLPAGTDIRSSVNHLAGGDWVEAPAGSARFYQVVNVDDAGKGFANEHRVAVLAQTTGFGPWPTPMP